MRSRAVLTISALVVIVGIIWLWLATPAGEPSYGGKSLSQWLSVYDRGLWAPEDGERTAEAVRAMGPKAIPKLLEWLQARDSKIQAWFCQIAGKQPLVPVRYTPASVRYLRAYQGFSALGPAAKPAIPELARLFQDPNYAAQAASVLAVLGPEAVPLLRAGLSNQHEQIRSAAARALGRTGQMPPLEPYSRSLAPP